MQIIYPVTISLFPRQFCYLKAIRLQGAVDFS